MDNRSGEEARRDIMSVIRFTLRKYGEPPTLRELADCTEMALGSVEHHVRVLVKQERLERVDKPSRNLMPTNYKRNK